MFARAYTCTCTPIKYVYSYSYIQMYMVRYCGSGYRFEYVEYVVVRSIVEQLSIVVLISIVRHNGTSHDISG